MDIFVYGTLKNGFSNHHIIRDSVFIGKDTTSDQYCMFDLGSFPAVVDTGNCCNIKGEVYCIDRDMLNSLDILEGKFFTRKKIKLKSNREVWMYFLDASACNTSNFPIIPDGVWNK